MKRLLIRFWNWITRKKTYRLTGWARSTGGGIPEVIAHNGETVWIGDSNTGEVWQEMDATFQSRKPKKIKLGTVGMKPGDYVDYDDMCLKEQKQNGH